MENRLAIGTLVCVLSFIAPPVVHAELIPVKAEGRSVIKGGSRNACFESARVHALREAVEQVSDIELRSRTKVTNATDIKDRILVETRGYISKYRVLEKNVVGDECIVQVRAAINDIKVREAIDEAIANLMEQLDIPAMGAQ
uniref:LPP20 lipoprotein n=1 Tax=Candidatus Kentrum sp. LFY TaxID=2126342 RepID=A0A450UNJ0_9GAMM|nr:MAG: LPP20 lipoprotein [Candidatus Kentron sp. LFY]